MCAWVVSLLAGGLSEAGRDAKGLLTCEETVPAGARPSGLPPLLPCGLACPKSIPIMDCCCPCPDEDDDGESKAASSRIRGVFGALLSYIRCRA